MLREYSERGYSECANAKGKNFSAELLFFILILYQQKIITNCWQSFVIQKSINYELFGQKLIK